MSNQTLSLITQWMYEEARQAMLEVSDEIGRLNQKLGAISHCIPWSTYMAETDPSALLKTPGGRLVTSIEHIRGELIERAIEGLHQAANDPQGQLPWDEEDDGLVVAWRADLEGQEDQA
jgi:hypothetical protein